MPSHNTRQDLKSTQSYPSWFGRAVGAVCELHDRRHATTASDMHASAVEAWASSPAEPMPKRQKRAEMWLDADLSGILHLLTLPACMHV